MRDCHIAIEGEVIAIDGKSLRGTVDKSRRQGLINMVSDFSPTNQVVLGQVKTADKSNEITVIPELLELLNIRGCLVSIDAMGCQKAIAKKVINRDADYLLSVKSNQPSLEAAFDNYFKLDMLQSDEGDTYSPRAWSNRNEIMLSE